MQKVIIVIIEMLLFSFIASHTIYGQRFLATQLFQIYNIKSVFVMVLKNKITILIIIIIRLDQILLSYISNISHTHLIITHYKPIGYVLIPIPNCSSHEGINFVVVSFRLVDFGCFGSICRRYDCSCRRSGCRRSGCRRSDGSLAINRDCSYRRRCFIQLNTRTAIRVLRIFGCFSPIKNC